MLKTRSTTLSLLRNFRSPLHEEIRTTTILRRVVPPRLSKTWYKQPRSLVKENYIYVYEEVTENKKKPNIDVILTQFVEGLGNKWDVVSVRPFYGLSHLIVPGLAMYATPENLKLRERMRVEKEDLGPVFSTRTSPVMIRMLKSTIVRLPMNRDQGWTVEPWHLRIALRQAGITVPEESIELPETPHYWTRLCWKREQGVPCHHLREQGRQRHGPLPDPTHWQSCASGRRFKPHEHMDTMTSPTKPTDSS
ncbi:hypothetical protein MTO96_003392 [Rhipicephalus appendiculatus]